MYACEAVYKKCQELLINYTIVEHPAVLTTEEADSYIKEHEGVRTKTLFLCNRKKTAFFLVILDDKKQLDIAHLASQLNQKSLRFASPEKLLEKMQLTPGSVSLFGLLNNQEHDIKVVLDKDMLSEDIITFHPNDNRKTLFMKMTDLFVFLNDLNYPYLIKKL